MDLLPDGESSVVDEDDDDHSPAPSTWAAGSEMSVNDTSFADFSESGLSGMDVDDISDHNLEPDRPSSPMVASRKRAMTPTSEISHKSKSSTWAFLDGRAKKKQKKEKAEPHGVSGISKSAISARESREAEAEGTVGLIDAKRCANWKRKILEDDPGAKFFDSEPRRVDHSRCGNPVKVKQLYDCSRWRDHLRDCDGILKKRTLKEMAQKSIGSIFKLGFTKITDDSSTDVPAAPEVNSPCPGLTELDEKLVPVYLQRSGAMGGGSRSIMKIAQARCSKLFSRLGKKEKAKVLLIQANEHTWRNDHMNLRVFSTACRGEVPNGKNDKRSRPCTQCCTVLRDKRFRQVLSKAIPSDENYIYVNHRFRNQLLGQQYARNIGLRDLIENSVCPSHSPLSNNSCSFIHSECEEYTVCSLCTRGAFWQI